MPVHPKNSPAPDPGRGDRSEAQSPDGYKILDDSVESAQPHDQDGVTEDMATLAVNPGILDGAKAPAATRGATNFADMEDSARVMALALLQLLGPR